MKRVISPHFANSVTKLNTPLSTGTKTEKITIIWYQPSDKNKFCDIIKMMKIKFDDFIALLGASAPSSCSSVSESLLKINENSKKELSADLIRSILPHQRAEKVFEMFALGEHRRIFEVCQKKNIEIIKFNDSAYPPFLREIPDFPLSLYVIGDKEILGEKKMIAVVGSRRPTQYGLSQTGSFVRKITKHGVVIVSGLAFGIDSAAHRSCLEENGKTIAVLGTPIDKIYPVSNLPLAREIIRRGGAIISEYPPDFPVSKYNFPLRNRIIAGLSDATLVMEASLKSGSLITANLAGEYGRRVFALPGNVDSFLSRGTNELIREGADQLGSPDDVLLAMGLGGHESGDGFYSPQSAERAILNALAGGALSQDEICSHCPDATAPAIFSALARLEVDGWVKMALDGSYHLKSAK